MPTTTLMLRALDVHVSVEIDSDAYEVTAAALGALVSPATEPVHADAAWTIEHDDRAWWLRRGRSAPYWGEAPEHLIAPLVHELNHLVARHSALITLHAGGVVHHDRGVLLFGPMESGKSTLTAGLVRRGCAYLSDEAVAIEPDSGRLMPYPKPLTLDPGSHQFFPELRDAAVAAGAVNGAAWNIPIAAVPQSPGVGSALPVGLVIRCEYAPGDSTCMEVVPRAEAVMELAASTFRFRERPREALDVLADLAARAPCYRLAMHDLEPAVSAVLAASDELKA